VEPVHDAVVAFDYADERAARIVERGVSPEVGEISGDRTRGSVSREGATVTVEIEAADIVALRAGLNTWLTLVGVAETAGTGA